SAGGPGAPPPSREEASHPLGKPSPVPAGTGDFQFMAHQPGHPAEAVAFDPCRPIHYVVNPTGAPPDGAQLIAHAIDAVPTATGCRSAHAGPPAETPAKDRPPYQPGIYGARWVPVLIAWSDEKTYPSLAGYIAGIAGPLRVSTPDGREVYVTGQVVLDRE